MALLSDRLTYEAIIDRPKLVLPDGARMAVWVIVNVEEWSIERAQPRTVLPPPMGQPLIPDVPNWSWHEYGMRVGFWRFMSVLERHKIIPTLAINGRVCESYPRVAGAAREAGWEFMGHGYVQGPMHRVENQKKAIEDTVEAIRKFTGKPPRGWESPGLTETEETLDLLRGAGIEYVADWVVDDLPTQLRTIHGPMIVVPYTVETNDITIYALQNHRSDELFNRGREQFDQLYRESADNARIMAISIHPYITGVPHRIRFLDELLGYIRQKDGVAFMTGEAIADWYREAIK
jgi:peptidoglycan/xylan/chitin deacetylase (PgdA/CDA1 family)